MFEFLGTRVVATCRAQALAFLISDRSPFVVVILCPLRACLDHLKSEDACLSYGTAPLGTARGSGDGLVRGDYC